MVPTDGVVGRSTDAGVSWNLTSIEMDPPLTPITGFHRFGERVIARSALGRLLLSNNDGCSWTLLDTDSKTFFTDGAFDPHHAEFCAHRPYRRRVPVRGGGESWQRIEIKHDAPKNVLSAVRFDEHSGSLRGSGPPWHRNPVDRWRPQLAHDCVELERECRIRRA